MQETLVPDSVVPVNEWLIQRESQIHGLGLFAAKAIPSGTQLIEYVGEKVTKEESARRCEDNNTYIFSLDDVYDLDGNQSWNPARLANHSCTPNCEAFDLEGRIWLFAQRDIQPGEEITFNYGYDLEDYEEHPCQCGSDDCVGFMVAEEFFAVVNRRRATKAAAGPPASASD